LKYLLILFVIALAVAPLTHFLPSKRQRQIARMREYAAVHGLFVEFRKLEGVTGVTERNGTVIYYGKRLPASPGRPVEPGTWLNSGSDWRSLGPLRSVPKPLLDLQVPVLGGSVDESSCGVYWTESAGEDAVEDIQLALERWHAELVG
jgi:hypothetical protein